MASAVSCQNSLLNEKDDVYYLFRDPDKGFDIPQNGCSNIKDLVSILLVHKGKLGHGLPVQELVYRKYLHNLRQR